MGFVNFPFGFWVLCQARKAQPLLGLRGWSGPPAVVPPHGCVCGACCPHASCRPLPSPALSCPSLLPGKGLGHPSPSLSPPRSRRQVLPAHALAPEEARPSEQICDGPHGSLSFHLSPHSCTFCLNYSFSFHALTLCLPPTYTFSSILFSLTEALNILFI